MCDHADNRRVKRNAKFMAHLVISAGSGPNLSHSDAG